jgi:hypothetical protein
VCDSLANHVSSHVSAGLQARRLFYEPAIDDRESRGESRTGGCPCRGWSVRENGSCWEWTCYVVNRAFAFRDGDVDDCCPRSAASNTAAARHPSGRA